MSSSSSAHEGWLVKSRSGARFSAAHDKRWFACAGMFVTYYASQKKKVIKGDFDLRHVSSIAPVADSDDVASAGTGAVSLTVSPPGKPVKVMILSFSESLAGDRDSWLRLWCSALEAKAIAPPLRHFIDATLGAELREGQHERAPRALGAAASREGSASKGLASPAKSPSSKLLPTATFGAAAAEGGAFEVTVPDGVRPGDRLLHTTVSAAPIHP